MISGWTACHTSPNLGYFYPLRDEKNKIFKKYITKTNKQVIFSCSAVTKLNCQIFYQFGQLFGSFTSPLRSRKKKSQESLFPNMCSQIIWSLDVGSYDLKQTCIHYSRLPASQSHLPSYPPPPSQKTEKILLLKKFWKHYFMHEYQILQSLDLWFGGYGCRFSVILVIIWPFHPSCRQGI